MVQFVTHALKGKRPPEFNKQELENVEEADGMIKNDSV
jgi:hypothetical protein